MKRLLVFVLSVALVIPSISLEKTKEPVVLTEALNLPSAKRMVKKIK